MNKRRLIYVGIVAFLLSLLVLAPALAQDRGDWLIVKRLTVLLGGSEFRSQVNIVIPTVQPTGTPGMAIHQNGPGDAMTVYNAAGTPVFKASSYIQADTYAQIGTFGRLVPATAITITNNGVLTPTGSFQPVQEASAVTITIATGSATAGDLLIVENLSNYTVTITDTTRSASPSLGQYDSAGFVYDGTGWLQLAASNN